MVEASGGLADFAVTRGTASAGTKNHHRKAARFLETEMAA
jgi:hypothetical protein